MYTPIQLLLVYDNGDGGGGGDGAASWCLMLDGVRGVLWKLASNTYKFEKLSKIEVYDHHVAHFALSR